MIENASDQAVTALSPAVGYALSLPQNYPLALETEQEASIQSRLASFDFEQLGLHEISTLGFESEQALSRVLDGFLSRIDQQNAPQLFNLVSKLNDSVDEQQLPAVAEKILNAKPSLMVRMLGLVYPKALKQASARLFEDISRSAAGKTKTLADLVNNMENTLRAEMSKLNDELRHLDTVKAAYRECFVLFVVDTAFLHNALAKARISYAANEAVLLKDTQRHLDVLDKLQALESRALAVEGVMSRLPADQLVIRQLQSAGVSTLQELATTMSSRFSSIKMTLLTIHGALQVRDLQRLGEQGSALDANLSQVRVKLMSSVVETAASAPGKNRQQQAMQLQQVVSETKALNTVVELARAKNDEQFKAARTLMAGARQEMLTLGKATNPGATVPARKF